MHRRNIVRWQTTARSRYGRYSLLGLRLCRMGLYRRRIRRRHPQHARSRHVRSADRFRPQLRKIQGSPRPGNARSGNAHPLIRRIENLVHPLARRRASASTMQPHRQRLHDGPPRGDEHRPAYRFRKAGIGLRSDRSFRTPFPTIPVSGFALFRTYSDRTDKTLRTVFTFCTKKAHRPQGRHACYFSRGLFRSHDLQDQMIRFRSCRPVRSASGCGSTYRHRRR